MERAYTALAAFLDHLGVAAQTRLLAEERPKARRWIDPWLLGSKDFVELLEAALLQHRAMQSVVHGWKRRTDNIAKIQRTMNRVCQCEEVGLYHPVTVYFLTELKPQGAKGGLEISA